MKNFKYSDYPKSNFKKIRFPAERTQEFIQIFE